MTVSASSEHRDVVATSNQANLHDAIAGLLDAIIAHCLPSRSQAAHHAREGCDRSTSVAAQATSLHTALSELIDDLLDTVVGEQGAIGSIDLHGVMLAADRCTIWTQVCLEEPVDFRPLALSNLTIEQAPSEVSLSATLRPRT